jgi:hypothetical protein
MQAFISTYPDMLMSLVESLLLSGLISLRVFFFRLAVMGGDPQTIGFFPDP